MSNDAMITIAATLVRETPKAYLLDCEGDETWLPKKQVKFNLSTRSLELPQWLLKAKFPNENH